MTIPPKTLNLDRNTTNSLKAFANTCLKKLVSDPKPFKYPNISCNSNWDIEKIKEENSKLLRQLRHNGNLYALYTRENSLSNWRLRYVGQSKSKSLRERISQHLISKNEQTGSKLENIKGAIFNGEEVALSYIKIEPESLREFIEEHIIRKETPDWNIQS